MDKINEYTRIDIKRYTVSGINEINYKRHICIKDHNYL